MAENADPKPDPEPEPKPDAAAAARLTELETQLKAEREEKAALEQQLQDAQEFKLPDDEGSTATAEAVTDLQREVVSLKEAFNASERRATVAEAALKHPGVPRSLLDKGTTPEEIEQIASEFTSAVTAEAEKMSQSIITLKEQELQEALGPPVAGTVAPLPDDLRKRVTQIEEKGGDSVLQDMAKAIITTPKSP